MSKADFKLATMLKPPCHRIPEAVLKTNKNEPEVEEVKSNALPSIRNRVSDANSKNMINLENILLLERKLCMIKESIATMSGLADLCEDWWEISHQETTLQNLGNVFKEPKFKTILKTSIIIEIAAVSVIYIISLHSETPPKSILISK